MISICIPIYNFNVIELINELANQITITNTPSEIVLIDDASTDDFKNINEEACLKHTYIKLKKNIGRAAIRNLFLKYTKYDNLLFLDCDSIVISDNFLSNYIDSISNNTTPLICGGRKYPELYPEKSELLRWKYGVYRESKGFEERMKNPNRSFMTNNFVISKNLFNEIPFEENLTKYGHEDTLFGFELKKRDIEIAHINNPILNGDLENNNTYLINTEDAIANLAYILNEVNYDKRLIEDITILRIYYKLFRVRNVIKVLFIILKPIIRSLLSKGYVNLHLFDFYKLGTLALKIDQYKLTAQ